MEWLIDNIVGIIAIMVAIIVGIIRKARLRVKIKKVKIDAINSVENTNASSIQQAGTINNGLNSSDVVELSQKTAKQHLDENFQPITSERLQEIMDEHLPLRNNVDGGEF